ncbi:MAG: serine/threonine-protein kinase [Gammaproteobacteria bacterium]
MNGQDRWIGRRLGAYEIVALLGSGGMGEVYRARRIDAQYEKEVAIKLVPSALPASFILQRLRAERQILARLDHPHIARLIDGGATEEGLPYLVLDLVDGMPLDRYCEDRRLPTRKRLQLFRDVCSAVSYAHQQLIVHRDLKPGNILVTADGTVKLLDFGIAKLLQPDPGETRPAHTITSDNTLTLEFASPEQLLGKTITTASDVYSLGVLLYLLLTRHMPYLNEPRSQHEAIREVCETEPARPSDVLAPANRRPGEKLDADLDAITLRALRKEPEKRYRSMEEFSEDVRRYLDGLPVIARDGQLAYRAGKFVRRRKLEIAASGLFMALLTAGIVSSLHQASIAEVQRARAQRHLATVRGFAELSMFQLHDAIKDLPGSTAARELLVSTAQQYLNALSGEAHRDRALQLDIAVAYAKVADIQGKAYHANTGEATAAVENYAKAIELLEPLVAAEPNDLARRSSLAQSYLQQSRLLLLAGETKRAIAGSHRAADIYESIAASRPSAATSASMADAFRVHAMNLTIDGSGKNTAMPYADRAVAILEDLHRQSPDDLDLEYQLGVAYGTAGDLVGEGDKGSAAQKRAENLHLKALAIDEHLVAATDGRNFHYIRSVLSDRVNLCSQFNDSGESLRAVEHCRAAVPLVDKLRADDKNAQIQIDGASLAWNFGRALLGAGELDEAATVFEENVRTLRGIPSENDSIQIQFLLAGSEEGLGAIHTSRATNAGAGRAEQLRHWRLAKEWYGKAVLGFQDLAKRIAIEGPDRVPMDRATAGLERSSKEVDRLPADR